MITGRLRIPARNEVGKILPSRSAVTSLSKQPRWDVAGFGADNGRIELQRITELTQPLTRPATAIMLAMAVSTR